MNNRFFCNIIIYNGKVRIKYLSRIMLMKRGVRALAWNGGRTFPAGFEPHLGKNFSLRNFGNSVYPSLPVSFGWYTKSRWSLLSCVYARGSKRSHQSELECVTVVDSTSHSKPPPEVRLCGWKSCPALKKEEENRHKKNTILQSELAWPTSGSWFTSRPRSTWRWAECYRGLEHIFSNSKYAK